MTDYFKQMTDAETMAAWVVAAMLAVVIAVAAELYAVRRQRKRRQWLTLSHEALARRVGRLENSLTAAQVRIGAAEVQISELQLNQLNFSKLRNRGERKPKTGEPKQTGAN
jgi:methylphosphotriester-DNA--protein-cysteine methyltransferase